MSIAICILMITSISASITQNVEQPQNIGQSDPSPTSDGSGGLADSPWPMFRQNLNHTGVSPYDTSGNNGQLKWSFETGDLIFSSPAIGSDGTIYIGSIDNKLYAINPDGTEKWSFTTGNFIYLSSPAISSDGTIYVGSYDNKLYAINSDGSEKWNFMTGDQVRSSPAIGTDGTIYIGSNDHKLYAINPDGTEKWNLTTGGTVESSPAIGSDGTIFHVGSDDLHAINPDGTEKWRFANIGGASSPAIGSDGTIYVGSNIKLYAINPDGTEKWNFTTGDFIYFSSPAISSDGTIYIGSDDNNLYAINPDGTEKWNFTTGHYVVSSPSIDSDGTIYVGSWDYKLYAIGTPNLEVNVTSHFSSLNSAAQSLITVHVTDGTNPVQGATVNLVSDNGGIFSQQSGITDANGDFKSIFNAPTITTQIICRITAEASKIGYNNGSGYVDVTINPIPWPMFRHNLNHTGQSPYDTNSNPGNLKWDFTTGGSVQSSPAIGSDGTIYVGSGDNKVYAINPDGTEKWNFTTGYIIQSSPTIGSDGTIYIGSFDDKLYAINPDGTQKWNFTTEGDIQKTSATIGSDGTIYIGSQDNKLYAINPDGTQKWNFTTGGSIWSSPTIGPDGTIYIGSFDDKVYAINPDGTEKWSFMSRPGIYVNVYVTPAIGSNGIIYIGSGDSYVYALYPNGSKKWDFFTDKPTTSSPAIDIDGTIYIGSYDGNLYAINPDGTEKWKFQTEDHVWSSPAIGSDGTIYFGSSDYKLYAINPIGTEKWNYTTDYYVHSSPAIGSDGTIYIGSGDNKLYAIGTPTPDINVEKTANVTIAKPGDLIEYTIHYNNTGPDEAGTVWINDTLPEGVTFVTSSAEGNRTGDYNWIFYNIAGDTKLSWSGPYLPKTRPSPRYDHSMAYHASNNKVVLFGGYDGSYYDDTWEYDTATKTWYGPYLPSMRPPGGFGHSMTYDSTNNRIVLFSGYDGSYHDEIWEYDTATHTWYGPYLPATRPSPRYDHAIAYDSSNNRVVLFGGRYSSTYFDETWEYDPSTHIWYGPFRPATRPSGRIEHAMTYDPINNRIVLFGGDDGTLNDETWEYDTATHSWYGPYLPLTRPSSRYRVPIIYDYAANKIVLFGGWDFANDNETWEYDTSTHKWYGPYPLTTPPSRRNDHAIAFDSSNNKIILFGGMVGVPPTFSYNDETWECTRETTSHSFNIIVKVNSDVPNGTILTNYVHLDHTNSFGQLMLDSSDSVDVLVLAPENQPPVADAGPDQTVNEGDVVQFMGCGSYDLDGSYSVNVKSNYPLTSDDYNQYYPSFHPDGTKIVYSSDEDGDRFLDIWIMDADGSNRTQLTFEDCNQGNPTYNSDGSRILYASTEDGEIFYDIWIMDADGSNHVQITFEYYNQLCPFYSPDDSKITFISDEVNGTFNIWIMDANGTDQMQLTNDVFFDFIYGDGYTLLYIERNPIFTPDGKRIIYESTEDGLSISDLWIMDLDGTNHTRLTYENFSQVMAHINKCGNLITYSSNEGPNSNPCIWLMDEKGKNHQQLISDSYFSTYPGFNPDGTKIVYCSSIDVYGPNDLWMLELDIENKTLEYYWDFDANVDSDSDGNFTNDVDATGPTPTHIYGDDGIYIVTLRVTDNDNLSATDTCNVTVQNVDPTVTIESITMNVEIGLRVAGRKYNNVSMALFEDGNPIGHVSIERLPGSPDEQMAWIPISINFSKFYSATVIYTPEDPPDVGGNPVWIYIKSQNGSIKKIHHTFNVQQSKKRDSEHWNHVEPWEVDLNAPFIGLPFEITSHIIDPGSDDEILTYTYGSQVKTVTYLNNPPNLDPYPSPEVNPVDITDTTTMVYEGTGTVTLVVKDDDNIRLGVGEGTDNFSVG